MSFPGEESALQAAMEDDQTTPKKITLFNLPPPPPKPVAPAPQPSSSPQSAAGQPQDDRTSLQGATGSSPQALPKTAFNFPKFATKKTRAANNDLQNFSKLIPALKKMTKKPGEGNDDKEDTSGSESEEEEETGSSQIIHSSSPTAALSTQIHVTVHATFAKKSENIKLSPYCVVSEAIKIILQDMDIDLEKYPNADLRLCKSSRSTLGSGETRVWLDPNMSLHSYHLKTGDELKLKNLKERLLIQINKPPSTTTYSFTYDFNTTVKAALLSLLKDSPHSQSERFGLYYPMRGIWLEEGKTLEFYEIDPTHSLDLRQLSQDILLKVSLPDSANKIGVTLKVVRSQTVGEIITMIHRKVNVENSHQCSLFYPAKNQWLENSKTLEDYDVEQNASFEYKSKFRVLTVSMEVDGAEKLVTVLVDPRATVADALNIISMSNPTLEEETFSLFYQYGLVLKNTAIAQDIPSKEALEYKVTPKPIRVSPAYDPSTVQIFEIDFTKPLKNFLPTICRRFGIIASDFALLEKEGSAVQIEKSLYQQRISPDTLFVLKTHSQGWVQKQPGEDTSEDIDIWSEPADNEKNLQFEAGPSGKPTEKVLCGSLNKLVERLTDDKTHDLAYVKTFLLTYRSFTTPEILLKKIIERYHVPRPVNAAFEDFERNIKRPIQLRVCNVLKQWIEKHSSDFLEGEALAPWANQVIRFIRDVLAPDDTKLAKQLLNTMEKLRDGTLQKSMREFNQEVDPPQIKYPTKENPKLFDHHSEEIAKQLTYIEFEIFQSIKPSEFLNQNWNRKNASDLSPNILRISERFNRTVLWVVNSILAKHQIRPRVKRFEKLIDIASHLQSLNNFSTLMAFVAGFNNAAVQRLKYTRAELSNRSLKRLEALEALMSAESSYKNYRSVIHSSNPPLIPYIGVYLADLTFIDDGNPSKIDGLINFSKRRLDYSVISEIQLYQNKPFNLAEFPELKALLLDFPAPNETMEKGLYEISLKVEPRGAERNQIE